MTIADMKRGDDALEQKVRDALERESDNYIQRDYDDPLAVLLRQLDRERDGRAAYERDYNRVKEQLDEIRKVLAR